MDQKFERQLTFDDGKIETSRITPTRYDKPTSLESAQQFEQGRKKSRHRARIFEFIKSRSVLGATCDEVEVALNLRHQTASCFIRFLTQDGFLKETEYRRITRARRKAIVWILRENISSTESK